ncbi:MAG: response regulator [Candidatus Taylorbacteria bacterium]
MDKTEEKKTNVLLVVEDENAMRVALIDKFKREGFFVTEASNGSEGLTRALKDHPNVIILDILMPVMDGLTMLKKLRKEGGEYGKKVPVILLTNVVPDTEKINQAVVEDEPAYYMMKTDFTIENVVEKVRERLDRVG